MSHSCVLALAVTLCSSYPIYSISLNIKVLLISNPSATMSLAFCRASLFASSIARSFHRNFSSSVNCITRGTSKVSCNHLVGQNIISLNESLLHLRGHGVKSVQFKKSYPISLKYTYTSNQQLKSCLKNV